MGDNETIDVYFARTLSIANQMSLRGEKLDQVLVIEKLMRSMSSRFIYVVCSIKEFKDVITLFVDDL